MLTHLKQKTYNLLRGSEKWAKTDMVYLAKGGFWLTFTKIVGSLTSFALAIAYAHLLSQTDYGIYRYVLSVAGMYGLATLTGMDSALIRSIVLGYEGSYKTALKAKIAWGLLGTAASIGMAVYYFLHGNTLLAMALLLAGIATPFLEGLAYGPFLEGKKLFKESSVYTTIRQVILAAVLILTLLVSRNIMLFIVVYFLSNLILQVVVFLLVFRGHKLNDKKDPQVVSFGKHLSVIIALGMAADYLDKIMTFHYLGAAQLAIYSFAIIPAAQLTGYLKAIPTLAFPKVVEKDIGELKRTLPKKILKFTLVIAVPVAIYILTVPLFFRIFFPAYMAAVPYSQLYALTLFFFPIRIVAGLLVAHVKEKELYILQVVSPVVRIGAFFVLLPLFGIYGVIAATMLSSVVSGILVFRFFYRL